MKTMKSLHPSVQNLFDLDALKAKAFIFDVDHTITKRSTGVRMASLGVRNGFISRLTMVRFPFYFIRYKIGKYTLENLPRNLDPLAGIKRDDMYKWGAETFTKYIEGDIYPEALALIRHLVENKRLVILCTSSLRFIIDPLADYLGVQHDHIMTTELGFDERGVCTGMIVGHPAFGQGKVLRVREHLAKLGISESDCAFFSDSINDLPLLSEVGWPVTVNPDQKLLRVAREKSWPQLIFGAGVKKHHTRLAKRMARRVQKQSRKRSRKHKTK